MKIVSNNINEQRKLFIMIDIVRTDLKRTEEDLKNF